MKPPRKQGKQKLICWLRVEYPDGGVLEVDAVRYFVGIYIAVRWNGETAAQTGCQTLDSVNRKMRKTIADGETRKAKVEFREIEVYPPGVYSPEELAQQQQREHAREEKAQDEGQEAGGQEGGSQEASQAPAGAAT